MMQTALKTLLKELEAFGRQHDAATDDRAGRMLNITPDTGEFLAVLTRASGATRILELGTSNGYSTLWLADAAGSAGTVTTVELSSAKTALARNNFARAGLHDRIRQVEGEAGAYLAGCDDASVDLLFLDSERRAYPDWWPQLARVLRPGGLMVVDNAVSHAQELAPFMQIVRADAGWSCSLVQVGKGQYMAVKH
jgi:predicted O-methyltransferase YrrM